MNDNSMNLGPNQGQFNPGINTFELIPRMAKDMRFVAYYSIITGALTCLTIIGAIWGVPLLISGLRLRDAADKYDEYLRINDINSIYQGFDKQRTYFFIQKVFIIVGLVFLVLYFGFIIILISSGTFTNFPGLTD